MRNLSNTALSCALDNTELTGLDPRVCIDGILDEASDRQQNDGSLFLRKEREKLTVWKTSRRS